MAVRLNRLNTRLASPVILKTLAGSVVDSRLASHNLLDRRQNAAPVLEDGEGHVFARAVGDEVWEMSVQERRRERRVSFLE